MKKLLSKRGMVLAGAALLALFLVRPPAGWLRERVTHSIAQAFGRNAEIGSVRLRFLPRPGFALEDLVVHDDPAFGAEPLLRAPEVTAWLRIGALLRGHIEIASLSLDNASLNLTRNTDSRWNLEDLMERASHTTMAPTSAGRGRQNPAFPYIEASSARINFKTGLEKTHFALDNADFALWQESENTWGMRLTANPIRTDANLTDTGKLTVSGIWQRAPAAHQTPLLVSFRWQKAQIGQVSTLFYGFDKGWRGGATLSGSISGTPDRLMITADASVDDLRRQEVLGGGNLAVSTHCVAVYQSQARSISNLDCVAPFGVGGLEFKGSASGIASGLLPFSSYDFWLVADKIPAQSALALARHVDAKFSDDVTASGNLDGAVEIIRGGSDQDPRVQGNGTTDQLQLTSTSTGDQVSFGTVPLRLVADADYDEHLSARARMKKSQSVSSDLIPAERTRVEFGPVNLAVGKAAPLVTNASLSRKGYSASVQGDATLKRLLQMAQLFRVPAPAVAADGHANVDLTIANDWMGSDRPIVTGIARLRSVQAQIHGLNAPLELANAELVISPGSVAVKDFAASLGGESWNGSMQIPRPCAAPENCTIQFNVHAAQLTASGLNKLLNPSVAKRSWYGFLSFSAAQQSYLLRARATGKIAVDQFVLGKSSCSHLSGTLRLDAGRLALSKFRGHFLDGSASGDLTADFASKPPEYKGSGSFESVSLGEVAELMHDPWLSGSGTAQYEFAAKGWNLQDLLASADLTAKFAIANGRFSHVVLNVDSGPLRARSFAGTLALHKAQFSLEDAKLATANGVYTVSGTALLNGALDLKIANENTARFAITGTIVKTRVTTVPTAQASLKP